MKSSGIFEKIKAILRKERPIINRPLTSFYSKVSGVIHVGANTGQERDGYKDGGLKVIWIEPIPEIFNELSRNIQGYPNQKAIQGLVSDKDDVEYSFHIANNKGQSSSIFELKHHKDVWPSVGYEQTIKIKSKTLTSILKNLNIEELSQYNALVLDTQGSELLVLKGATAILDNFKFIRVEVADFEAYEGCCQLSDIQAFLKPLGYYEYARFKTKRWKQRNKGYYDIVYKRSRLRANWYSWQGKKY
jgi:FkbM family methyltransferase